MAIKRIDEVFSKGLISDKGVHNYSFKFSPDSRNVRIVNGALAVRKGFHNVFTSSAETAKAQALASNSGTLFGVYGQELYEIDLSNETETKLSTSSLPDSKTRIVQFSDRLILLTGEGYPYVRDVGASSWAQLTSTNIESGANPRFGTSWAYFTFVAGGGDNKDMLYMSRGITKDNPEYAYDWAGTGSNQILLRGEIKGMASTISRIFIFTDKTLEYFSGDTINVGGSTTPYTKPISKNNVPVSPESVVVAQDRVFVFTTDFVVKEVGMGSGIDDIEIKSLSDRPNQSIAKFMDSLDSDQSNCFGFYNEEDNLVQRHLKKGGASFNNITLTYDLKNDTFLVDDSKMFNCGTYHDNKIYMGSELAPVVYRDNDGYDDDNFPIRRKRSTTNLDLGDISLIKSFREVGLKGEYNSLSNINIDVYVDDNTVAGTYTLSTESQGLLGLGAKEIGEEETGGHDDVISPVPFERYISKGELRAKGYKIQVSLYGDCKGARTVISGLGIGANAVKGYSREKKI